MSGREASVMEKLPLKKTLKAGAFFAELEKEEVRKRVDVAALFSSFGVSLERKGKSLMGRCPFHEDTTPSLSVEPEKGLYHCFGCGESGDVFDLVMKTRGLSFPEALQYLKGQNGGAVSLPKPGLPGPPSEGEEKDSGAPLFSLSAVADFYHRSLFEHPEAVSYLEGRGLRNRQLWSRYRIGFSAGLLAERLSSTQKAELAKAGVLMRSGGEFFAGCITVPLLDEQDQVAGFYGRRIDERRKVNHLYLPGAHRGLFNRKAFAVYPEELILAESVLDALSLLELGFQNVVPCYGVGGFTTLHEKAMREARVKTVVIGFDADEAGRKGAQALKERLLSSGISVKLVVPPSAKGLSANAGACLPAKDWNEALIRGVTSEAVAAAVGSSPLEHPAAAAEQPFSVLHENGKTVFRFAERCYRLLGAKDLFAGSLRVNVRAEAGGEKYIDNVDLYSGRSRAAFASSLAGLFGHESKAVERELLEMLEYLEDERERKLRLESEAGPVEVSAEERALGLALLSDPELPERILRDMETLGYVGEPTNKLLLYLAATSRKLSDPLSVLVISESGAGKSYLIDTVKALLPPEDVISMTSLSDQALNYLPEDALLHKFLVMGEALHSEPVELQVREMLSSHELSRLVTMKDPKTGELSSRTVRKKVIVAAAMSTTNNTVNPENASRFFIVSADESREQTSRIHESQRRKYSLSRIRQKQEAVPRVVRTHQAAQRLLQAPTIVNPFAELLSFPTSLMRTRRDHERFLDLIASVCLLRQFQKEEREEDGLRFIECDIVDYRLAYRVLSSALPSTLGGIPESARAVYEAARALLKTKAEEAGLKVTEVSASQREVRERSGLSQMAVKRGFHLLLEYEYLVVGGLKVRGSRRAYRLLCDEPIRSLDLSGIPSPEEMEWKLQNS